MQSLKAPKFHQHLSALHFVNGEMTRYCRKVISLTCCRQVIAHHFCSHVSEEMHQCVIYDSNEPGARLIGIEYIVTKEIFENLPDEEKKYWHSHHYEVKSGLLAAPGIG